MAGMAEIVVYVADAKPVRDLIDAAVALDGAVLTWGMTHQTTISKYMAFRVALRALQDTKENADVPAQTGL
jgi:hypothetical protein